MELYRHQKEAVAFTVERPATALMMDPGTGKTLVAIRAVEEWARRERRSLKVLLIAPLTLLRTWQAEWHKFGVGSGQVAIWPEMPEHDWVSVLAINYDKARDPATEQKLKKWGADVVIADEGHKLKGRSSKQSKAVARIGKRAGRRLLLTGSPVANSPLDVFGQYRYLDPSVFGTRWGEFSARYAKFGGYGGYQIVGYQNLDELAEKAHSIAFRARKEDCLDLPPTTDTTVLVTLDAKERRAYNELRKHALTVLDGGDTCTAQMALVQLLHLQRATGGWVKTDDKELRRVGSSKLEALEEIVESATRPLLVFARFRHEIAQILGAVKGAQCLTGETLEADRARLVEMFQAGKIPVLVCQTAVGGIGLTLTAADCAIFYSVGYSLTEYEQARARINRIGQTLPVTYIHLVAEDTVDEEVLGILQSKRDMAALVVDDLRDAVRRAVFREKRS